MLVYAWTLVLAPLFNRDSSHQSLALMLAYPVSTLTIASVSLSVLGDACPQARATLRWIVAAELLSTVGVFGFVLQSRHGVAVFGWPQVLIEAGLVSLIVAGEQPLHTDDPAPHSDLELFLPYVPVVVATVTNLVALARGTHTFGFAEAAVAAVMLGSLLGRQTLHATELKWQARTDALTGLANRAAFLLALRRQTARAAAASVLLIDVDEFKEINDSFGHAAGDEVLTGFARHVAAAAASYEAVVARLGGDEFAVLVTGDDAAEAGDAIARDLTRWHRLPTGTAGRLNVSVSIGIAAAEPRDAPSHVLRRADLAMYDAKRRSGPTEAHYEPSFTVSADRRVTLARDLDGAAGRGEMRLVYQPIYHLGTQQPQGVEALLRWRHPVLGDVTPAEFIPVAEETGSIIGLGEWVIRTAVDALLGWEADGIVVPQLFVNVSADQLRAGLTETLARVLPAQFDRHRLVLEVTESRYADAAVRAECDAVRATGVKVAIDDFGSGWSTLAELASLRIDVVKLDRAFCEHVGSTRGRHVIATIMRLAGGLGLTTVAEGIETAEQGDVMRDHGCALGQGFHLRRPIEASAVAETLGRTPVLAAMPPQRDEEPSHATAAASPPPRMAI